MNVRFHPPEAQENYAELVLAVLLRSAMPAIRAQLAEAAVPGTADPAKEGETHSQ